MTDREKFEREWQKLVGTPVSVLEGMRAGEKYKHTTHDFLNTAYTIWQAALASQNDGWIEWAGGECPVMPNTVVQVRCVGGASYQAQAAVFKWHTVIAYRVVKP